MAHVGLLNDMMRHILVNKPLPARPNPVLALRAAQRDPKHLLGAARKEPPKVPSPHTPKWAKIIKDAPLLQAMHTVDIDRSRFQRMMALWQGVGFSNMPKIDTAPKAVEAELNREAQLANWKLQHGLRTPTYWETRKAAEEYFSYDTVPLVGNVAGIPVKDIHQLGFIVQQEGRAPQSLKSVGWKQEGNGCYSHVFSHVDSSYAVVKVCWDGDLTKLWLNFAKLNKGKVGVPEVYGVYRLGKGYMVVMERLNGGADVPYEHPTHMSKQGGFNLLEKMFSFASRSEYSERLELFTEDVKAECLAICGKEYEDMYNVIACFLVWLPQGINRFDMHSGNAMYNGAGNVVLTDPITN